LVRIPLNPSLKIHTGTMFAGKTDGLLADLRKHVIAGRKVILFKPVLDDRYAEEEVTTHDGRTMPAIPIKHIGDIFKHIDKTVDVIGIDEVQFFNIEETIEVVERLLWLDITVIAAGLDMDYKGRPFGSVPYLMAMADGGVIKHEAVCTDCGGDSHFEYRKDRDDSNLVKLGGKDEYDSLCRRCRKWRKIGESKNSSETDSNDIHLSGSK
jgi:thymidine kinase